MPTPIQTTTYPIAQPAFTTAPIPVYDTRPFQLTYQSSLPPPALYSNPPTAPLFPTTGFKSSSLGPSPNYVSSMPPSSTYDYRPLQLENKAYPINNYPPLNNFSLVSKAPAQSNSVSMEATKFNFPHEPSPRHVESQFTTFKNIENKDSQSMTFNYTSGNTYQFTPSNFQPPTPNTFGQPTSTSQYTCNLPQYQSMTTGNFGQSIRYPPREPPQMQPIPDSQHKQHDPLHYESNKPVYSPLSGGNAHIKHAQSVTYDNLNLKSYSPQVEQYGY